MKRLLFFLLLALFLSQGGFFFGKVFAQEKIDEFEAKIHINQDGTINVEEKIVYDFSSLSRHGIFREIPFIKKNQEGKKFLLEFSDFKITDENGLNYSFVKTKDQEKIKLKIGDPNKTVTGVHTYIISYKVTGALTYFSEHDELYWNITGNQWPILINAVKTEIFLPKKIEEKDLKLDCFTGTYGVKEKSCQFYIENDRLQDRILFKANQPLKENQGLSIVVGFPKNIVAVLEPKEYQTFWETFLGKIIQFLFFLAVFIWYVCLPFYIIYRWFKYGRDPKFTSISEVTAWFDPPKAPGGKRFLTPAEVGVLGDETVDLKDISAMIVDLARRGYLRIEERNKNEFWLVITNKDFSKLLGFEKKLLTEFFDGKNEINLKKARLYQEVELVKKAVYQEVVDQGLFPENPEKIRTKYLILAVFALMTFNLFLAFVSFVFGRAMPRKTIKGVEAKNIAFSLRNFLRSQQRQLTFQADKQMLFEKLLPYAIVFGVEQIWAKRFKDLDIKPPEWYQAYDQRNFNSVVFANSLNSSLSSFKSSANPPTSTRSTRGFSSGFSGGFSGGGGGGGGGGSW